MPRKYNTVITENTVERSEERAFLRQLSACVNLTPAEEDRILPSVGQVVVEEEEFDEWDDVEPTYEEIIDAMDDKEDAELVHDFLTNG